MTMADSSRSPGALENALSRLQCVLVARRSRYTPETVTWGQYDILELLRLRGAATPSQLSERLAIARTGVSKALRVLKDLDLVAQTSADGDRREQVTILTEHGLDFLTRAAIGRQDGAQRVMAALTPGEQAIFTELCDKASAALESSDLRDEAERA
ncbi:MarR family transcriptional regulator [Brenneria populi]|uniref:MarR family transcriptional regulator n=1 Tax=Brenneria populi TaxID=1505588 RepID=A0ABU6JW97_9GAMM|nr:MarR family transcriptional regulator [Brenneria populi Li et al. 2015]